MPTERNDKAYLRYQKHQQRYLNDLTDGRGGRKRKRNDDLVDDEDFRSSESDEDLIRKLKKVEEEVVGTDEAMEPFNLNEERETGVVSREGVLIQDTKARINDTWLDSIEGEQPYKAPNKESSDDEAEADVNELKAQVKSLLCPKESVAQALRRLRGLSQPKKKPTPSQVDLTDFNKLNEASSELMGLGFADVYEWTAEDLN